MMKRGLWKMPTVLAAFGLALAMVLTGCPTSASSPDNDPQGSASMLESAHPNNDFGTTAIILEFDGPIADLTAENIVVFPGTGEVETRGLTGGGSRWALAVTVIRYGVVSVKIDKEGIATETHEVTVHPVDWRAELDNSTPDKNAIRFIFKSPIQDLGLEAEDIVLFTPVGNVVRGDLTNIDGRQWSLEVTLEGDVSFLLAEIYRDGITPFGNTDATSPYHIPISSIILEDATINISSTTGEKTLVLTFSKPVLNLTVDNIKVTAGTGNFTLGSPLTASSDGTVWTVPVTTANPGGLASVSIDRTGISKQPVTVLIPGVILEAARICGHEVEGQKSLVLTFSDPLSNLALEEVGIREGTGNFRLGASGVENLRFSTSDSVGPLGTIWTIPVTIIRGGLASVSVSKPGVLGGPIEIELPSPVSIESARYMPGDVGDRWIEFTLVYPVPDLDISDIRVTGETARLTLATGTDALQGTHPWKSWRVKVDSIQREGTALLGIEKEGVSDVPARVHIQQVLVTHMRVINTWDAVGRRSAISTPLAGSLGIEITLSAPVASAPRIEYGGVNSSYTLEVTYGEVFGSGVTWVLPITVTNSNLLPAGNWGSGRFDNVVVTGEAAPDGSPDDTLDNIRTVTIPRLWGLVGPGAPATWICPEREPEPSGWNAEMIDW